LQYELLPWVERAIALDGAPDHHLFAAAVGTAAIIRGATGDGDGQERLAIAALRHEQASGSSRRFEPAGALANAYWRSGQTDRQVEACRILERIAGQTQDPLEVGQAWFNRSTSYVATDLDGVGTSAEDAVHDAQRTGNPYQLAFAHAGTLAIAAHR